MPQALSDLLRTHPLLVVPGVYDALLARLVDLAGFEALYISGAGIAYSQLATPDLGLVTLTELVQRVNAISAATRLPCIVDADTGHGGVLNVYRTVRELERAGAAAIQLEDQAFPKRCGHLPGRSLVPIDEMVARLRAAQEARTRSECLIIARTDAAAVVGLTEALRRGHRYIDAGADILFIESPNSISDLEQIGREFGASVPLMVNMVEGGRTPLVPPHTLRELGFRIVIYPNSLTRSIIWVASQLLRVLREEGTTQQFLDRMISFSELQDLLALPEWQVLEERLASRTASEG